MLVSKWLKYRVKESFKAKIEEAIIKIEIETTIIEERY